MPILKVVMALPQTSVFGSSKFIIMTTESISFMPVLNKYILYSEAMSQYCTLEEEDKKIIEPYITRLKELWQDELQHIKLKLQSFPRKPNKNLKNSCAVT